MKARIAVFLSVAGLGLFAGCGELKFGDDTETQGPGVTAEQLQQVSALTGIRFPEGTVGLGYLYLGSGIDDALAAKVALPAGAKEAFLQNAVFRQGRADAPHLEIGKSKSWWQIHTLTDRMDRTLELPQGRFVECSLGLEQGEWVAYVSWIST